MRQCGITPVKCTLEINFSVFRIFGQFIPPLGDLLLAILHLSHLPVFLLCFIWGKYLLNSSIPRVATGCQGLQSWNFRVWCWDGQFLSASSKGQGRTPPEMAWLKPQKPKNRASAFWRAPTCPTAGEEREDEAGWGSTAASWKEMYSFLREKKKHAVYAMSYVTVVEITLLFKKKNQMPNSCPFCTSCPVFSCCAACTSECIHVCWK